MAANAQTHTNGTYNTAPQREKVVFPINQPVVLQLDYDDGQLCQGRFGDQYQYTFDGGTRIAWLDPEVRDLILRSGAKQRDEIAICKREVKGANGRKRAQWEVEKVEDESSFGPSAAEIAAAERAQQEARANAQREEAERLARAAQPAPAKATRAKKADQPAASPLADPRTEVTCKLARDFADCLLAAVAACQLSTGESEKLGFPLPWTAQDVRTIATTMYINAAKGPRA